MTESNQTPKTAQEFALRAEQHFNKGNYGAAILDLDEVIRLQPDLVDGLSNTRRNLSFSSFLSPCRATGFFRQLALCAKRL